MLAQYLVLLEATNLRKAKKNSTNTTRLQVQPCSSCGIKFQAGILAKLFLQNCSYNIECRLFHTLCYHNLIYNVCAGKD